MKPFCFTFPLGQQPAIYTGPKISCNICFRAFPPKYRDPLCKWGCKPDAPKSSPPIIPTIGNTTVEITTVPPSTTTATSSTSDSTAFIPEQKKSTFFVGREKIYKRIIKYADNGVQFHWVAVCIFASSFFIVTLIIIAQFIKGKYSNKLDIGSDNDSLNSV